MDGLFVSPENHTRFTRKGMSKASIKDKKTAPKSKAPFVSPPSEAEETGLTTCQGLISVVSCNVLSLHSENDGTYLNLDGSAKALDVQHRRKLINEKISKWMQDCKVICLQEATASLIMKEFNPALAALQEEHEFECHSHFYQFQQNRTDPSQMGTNILGLEILFPRKFFRAVPLPLEHYFRGHIRKPFFLVSFLWNWKSAE